VKLSIYDTSPVFKTGVFYPIAVRALPIVPPSAGIKMFAGAKIVSNE
jgi:hypothetical protein